MRDMASVDQTTPDQPYYGDRPGTSLYTPNNVQFTITDTKEHFASRLYT